MSLDPVLLASFSATEARERLVAGDCSVRDYARALLARVDAIESQVQAWAHLDRAHVLAQAGAADEARVLLEAGAAEVQVLTLARAVRQL